MHLLRKSLIAFGVLFLVGWSVPHVSAAAVRWLSAPPTRAALVAAPLPGTTSSAAAPGAKTFGSLGEWAITGHLQVGFVFDMVAATVNLRRPYDGDFAISLRTSLNGRRWSAWQPLSFDSADGRPGSAAPGNTCSEPLWVGGAYDLEYRCTAEGCGASDLHFSLINTSGDADLADRVASGLRSTLATIVGVTQIAPAGATTSQPSIVTRAEWGANESWRSGNPGTTTLSMAFVHHTASGNDYTQAEAPAIVRAIYYYHTHVMGWYDIGYNFLIDKFGTIYEGRHGSIAGNPIGAQVLGFNDHTMGVALIGTFATL